MSEISARAGARTPRPVVEVSRLPSVGFGHRGPLWWGVLGFMVTEGTTLAITAWSFFYLRKNFDGWPPSPNPPPGLLAGTLGMALLLVAIWPMARARRCAHALDPGGTFRWLIAATVVSTAVAIARAFEFAAVRVRWDDNAYGSVVWLLLGLHATLVLTDVFETLGIALLVRSSRRRLRHFSDVDDAALYQWFLSLVWLPVYLMIYWLPRLPR